MARGRRRRGLAAALGDPAGPDRCARRDLGTHGHCRCAFDLGGASPSRGMGQPPLLVYHLTLGQNRGRAGGDRDGFEARGGAGSLTPT